MPASFFTKAPVEVPITLAILPHAAPPSVKLNTPVIVSVLETLIVPAPPDILLTLPNEIKLPKVTPVVELFIKAPLLEMPVPFMIVLKLPVNANPAKSNEEPFLTVKTPVPAPRLTAVPNCKVLAVEPVPIFQFAVAEIEPPD